jgi:hypothetical protein
MDANGNDILKHTMVTEGGAITNKPAIVADVAGLFWWWK